MGSDGTEDGSAWADVQAIQRSTCFDARPLVGWWGRGCDSCSFRCKHNRTDDQTAAPATIRPTRCPPVGLITHRAVPSSFSMTGNTVRFTHLKTSLSCLELKKLCTLPDSGMVTFVRTGCGVLCCVVAPCSAVHCLNVCRMLRQKMIEHAEWHAMQYTTCGVNRSLDPAMMACKLFREMLQNAA